MTSAMNFWPDHDASAAKRSTFSRIYRQIGHQVARVASSAQSDSVLEQRWGYADTSVTSTSQGLLGILERFYVVEQREHVLVFLEQHPHLVVLLVEAFSAIQVYFQGVQVVLRLSDDPEQGALTQLGLYILVPDDNPQEAVARLAALDDGWWLDSIDRSLGALFITITAI